MTEIEEKVIAENMRVANKYLMVSRLGRAIGLAESIERPMPGSPLPSGVQGVASEIIMLLNAVSDALVAE